ncbi:hypothetical protein [Poritiphilus flavus]|uniref:Uncharacterized protein n=1 Tax=Poritiphilus flavus TaxID=2697053 RepID=A0A6L9EEB8_9FLAO|nr:hypothetical protein [Poritiphilus flavus]NAS12679.1 hypothetical protein [Poritiphilus flavus]
MENRLIRWVKAGRQSLKKSSAAKEAKNGLIKSDRIVLVEGTFSPLEAADVLLSLLNDKIKFHTVQALNLRDRQAEDNQRSERRIAELKEAKQHIKDLVVQARNDGLEIVIDSLIDIKLRERIPKPHTN